ncbi:DUF6099 family protein [Kitasatospora sp. NBC_00315]|uniref:DUF6099 family protein n=1 Tax=Kitasatospora sp. NBC_00315 TaxID=2975963 RepID=UPI0032566165
MDALRLIRTARHALAEARDVPDVLLEAWQAGLLTEAVGGRLADREEGELAALGQLLCEAGAQVASCLEPSPESSAALDWGGVGRASRLTDLGELDPLLEELGKLLHDATDTLVVLACGADAESLYWTCIDGVDAGAECKDLVAELHRAVRNPETAETTAVGVAGVAGVAGSTVDGPAAVGRRAAAGRADGADGADGPAATAPTAHDRPVGAGLCAEPCAEPCTEPCADLCAEPRPAAPRGAAVPGRPVLVVPLTPPSGGERDRAYGASVASAVGSAVRSAVGSERGGPAAAEDCRAAPMPARSVLTDASSSCICASRPRGVSGAVAVAGSASPGPCGVAGGSDHGADIRGPLRLGSAV